MMIYLFVCLLQDELLSQVDAPPITTPTSPVGVAVTKVVTSNPPQSLQPKPKPPTKQLSAMTGEN